MRFSFAISTLAGTVACANPVLLPPALKAYIASERVVISITPTHAAFTATFTFRSGAETARILGTSSPPASVDLPIWFPEDRIGDTPLQRFWVTFQKDRWNLLATAQSLAVFEETVGLRVRIGEHELAAGHGIDRFYAWPSRTWLGAVPTYEELGPVPSETSAEYPHHVRESLARMFLEQRYGTPLRRAPAEALEPGFYCLVFNFPVSATFVQEHTPLVVSYHQPLVDMDGEGQPLYIPVFDHLPKDASTADTNSYSITVTAKGCTVLLSSAGVATTLKAGEHLTIPPKDFVPIRARANPGPNKRAGVDAGFGVLFAFGRPWPGTTQHGR